MPALETLDQPSSTRLPKLAQRLADRLSAEIVDAGMEEGAPLGREADLAIRLATSRWTVREAINILEQAGEISIRRGRNGGIFVAAPGVENLSRAISSYLEFIRVDINEIIEARRVLDEAILTHAAHRVSPPDIAALRDIGSLDSEIEGVRAGFVQYAALLDAARSPVLQTFVRAVGQLGVSAMLRSRLSDEELAESTHRIRLRRRDQIEAIIAGQVGQAIAIENDVLRETEDLLGSAKPDPARNTAAARMRALHFFTQSRQFKRPELLMHEIASDIVAQGWPVGAHLGSEPELQQRYGASRSAFREAIRSLEQIGVVEMRTGRHSGLKIGEPNPDALVANCHRQFARLALPPETLEEALDAVGAAAVGLAARRTAGAMPETALSTPGRFAEAIGASCGNRILSLLLRIVTGDPSDAGAPRSWAMLERDELGELADAIESGDEPVARRILFSLRGKTGTASIIG